MFCTRSRGMMPVGLILLALILLRGPAFPSDKDLELVVDLGEVYALAGDENVLLPVYLSNFQDTVAAFELWFHLDRPNVAYLELDVDTGRTMISGWDYLDVRRVVSDSLEVKVTAIADIKPPMLNRGIPPQAAQKPLFNLLVSVLEEPDPYSGGEVLAEVQPVIENFGFSTPDARSLGIIVDTIVDISYFVCMEWSPSGGTCLEWEEVAGPPYDSIYVDSFCVGSIDYEAVNFLPGSLTIVPGICGDIDGSFDGLVDMSDLTRIIDHLFISLEPLPVMSMGNVDGSADGMVDMSDLDLMIRHLFIDFRELECIY